MNCLLGLLQRVFDSLKALDPFMRECASDEVCDLADTSIVLEARALSAEEECKPETRAIALLAPTLGSFEELARVVGLLSRHFTVGSVHGRGGEIAVEIGGESLRGPLETLSRLARSVRAAVEGPARVVAFSYLSEEGHGWTIKLQTCLPLYCDDSPREIAEASATALAVLVTGLRVDPGLLRRAVISSSIVERVQDEYKHLCTGIDLDLEGLQESEKHEVEAAEEDIPEEFGEACASRALQVERELDEVYKEIGRIKGKLQGRKRERADEIEGRMYTGELTPSEALQRIRKLARDE